MDLVNRSSDFELTLEEYLEIDSDIKITPSFVSPSPVKRLGILMLSLMALLNLGPE
jgi:hypothetical protein